MERRKKPVIGITMGDPAGIGAEVTVKALCRVELYERCIPVVIGDRAPVEDVLRFAERKLTVHVIEEIGGAKGEPGTVDLLNMGALDGREWRCKQVSAVCGNAAFAYVEKGISLALTGALDAVVTAPVNKEALHLAGRAYSGHTEIFADLTGTKDYAMLLCGGPLRVMHVTTHVSMRRACKLIKKERVLRVIELADEAMRMLGIGKPCIAVAGFNAHCSENGLFGSEEAEEIFPAVEAARAQGIVCEGPIPPDTVFVKAAAGLYDAVVAMYHDQGHIPVKLSGFSLDPKTNRFTSMSGINCTIGLPIIRTSVDHGTAFDRAGDGISNEESMVEAIEAAIQMASTRAVI